MTTAMTTAISYAPKAIIPLAIITAAIGINRANRVDRRRNTAHADGLATLAAERGWTYTPAPASGLASGWSSPTGGANVTLGGTTGLQSGIRRTADPAGVFTTTNGIDSAWLAATGMVLFSQGHNRSVLDTLTGQASGRSFRAFTYQYFATDSRGREYRNVYHFVAVDTGLAGPAINLSREGTLSRTFDAISGQDIDFEDEQFNRAYRVTCDDRKHAYDVLDASTMQAIKALNPANLCWTAGSLITTAAGTLPADPGIDALAAVANLVPARLTNSGNEGAGA